MAGSEQTYICPGDKISISDRLFALGSFFSLGLPSAMEDVQRFSEEDVKDRKFLSSGGEGKVFVANHEFYGRIAVKFANTPYSLTEINEIKNMLKIKNFHDNIVPFIGIVTNRKGLEIGYVMKYMDGGSLATEIHNGSSYKLKQAFSWIEMAARGLSYLHEKGIIHRDVKPLNMLLSDKGKVLMICDLGLARPFNHVTSARGTMYYMAPECFRSCKHVNYPADVWSFGVSIWEILRRKIPYNDENQYIVQQKVERGELRPVWGGNSDKDLKDLFDRIFAVKPEVRPKMLEIRKFATEKKEICSDRWILPSEKKKRNGTGLESQTENLSLEGESSSGSTKSDKKERSKIRQKGGKQSWDDWLQSSRSISCLPYKDPNLQSMHVNSQKIADQMASLSRKRSINGVGKLIKDVTELFRDLLDEIGNILKFYPKKEEILKYKEETEEVMRDFEKEAEQKKIQILSDNSQK